MRFSGRSGTTARLSVVLALVVAALPALAQAAPPEAMPEAAPPLDFHGHWGFHPEFYFGWGWPYWAGPPRPLGLLQIEDLDAGAVVSVDGAVVSGFNLYLTPGVHQVVVSRFGYRDFASSVEIRVDRATTLLPTWVAVPFAITGIEVSPGYFDPADPGYLGSCTILLRARAPGAGSVTIADASGRLVRTFADLPFDQPTLTLRWNGRDEGGRVVAPGFYRISSAEAAAASTEAAPASPSSGGGAVEARVRVAPGLVNRSSSLFTGVSGALFAPDARVLPAGRTESALFGLGHFSGSDASLSGELALGAGFRAGMGAPSSSSRAGWEFAATALTDLHPGQDADASTDTLSGTISLKHAFSGGSPAAALYLRGSFASYLGEQGGSGAPYAYDWTRFPGLSVGLPLELDLGSLRLFVSPEAEISSYYPSWDRGPWSVPGLFAWGYLRAGIESTMDGVSIDLSAALPTDPWSSAPIAVRPPISVGGELRWYAPGSPFVLSVLGAGVFSNPADPYLSAGLALTFRFG